MLESHYDKTADTMRFVSTTGDKQELNEHLSDIPCLIQPIDSAENEDREGIHAKSWLMMCDEADIIDGDRVIIDSDEYRVVGAETLSWQGHTHMEITLRKHKN